MHTHSRIRGVQSILANGVPPVFAQLQSTIEDFKDHHNAEIKNMGRHIDELNASIAALKLGGGGGGDRQDRNLAYAGMIDFMRSGNTNAMVPSPARAAMSTDSNPDGGFTVPGAIDSEIQSQLVAYSPMRSLANVVVVNTSDYTKVINRRGAQSGWVGERDDRPETDTPVLATINPPIGEVYANAAITQWALDDSAFNLDTFLIENILDKFALDEGSAFVTGDGVKKPRGFLAVPAAEQDDRARPFGTFEFIRSGNASGFITSAPSPTVSPADVLIDLVYKLRAPYRAGRGVGWLMNSKTAGVVMKFKDIGGNYIWTNALSAGQPPLLCGFPVYMDENMPDIGANAFPIAFGDFKAGYIIVDRKGVNVLRDPYTKPGWVKFYMTRRVGGAPADTNAIKFLKIAA